MPESSINFKNHIKFEVRFLIAMAIFQVLDSQLSKWLRINAGIVNPVSVKRSYPIQQQLLYITHQVLKLGQVFSAPLLNLT